MLVQHPHECFRDEGQPAGHELVQDDAQRIDVDAMIGLAALGLLRRHVVGRAEDHAGLGLLRLSAVETRELGDAEVEDLHEVRAPRVVDQKYVLWLEIPVNDSLGVGRRQPATDLDPRVATVCPVKPPDRLQPVTEVAAVQVLHHEEHPALGGRAEVRDVDDVLVSDAARGLGLADESLDHVAAVGELLVEHLQRDLFLDDDVLREVDDAHPALPQQLEDAVAIGEHLSDELFRVGFGQVGQSAESPSTALGADLRRSLRRSRRGWYGPHGRQHGPGGRCGWRRTRYRRRDWRTRYRWR